MKLLLILLKELKMEKSENFKKELEYIKNTSEKQMYLNDLNNLRKELEKDFK